MADGLSIAASVAGLVSLGFQVCSGITKYLDGIKSRAEELDSARKYEQTLKTSIQALENILPQLVAHNQHSSTAVIACIQLCKDELEALRRLVAELCDETRNNPNLLDRAKASKKRLTYAFNRSRLTNLQARVDKASKSLQVTLQILGLESSISQGQTLRTIESTSNDAVAEIIETKVEVTALANDVSHIRNEATLLRAAIESIGLSLLDLGQTAIRSEQGIRVIREDATRSNRLLATQSSRIGDQVDAIQIQNALNHGATTKLLQLTQLDKASARPGKLFNQMISRPSYLEEVSEECLDVGSPARDVWNVDDQPQMSVLTTTAMDRQSSTSMLQFRSSRKCTCRPRHRLQRKQAVWSGFIFYQDNSWSENHLPECDFWQHPKTTEQKWGIRQVGLGWLAHKAIELTFSCKFGAGGASFGPNFTYYPTVDEDAAPAFQIIKILNDAAANWEIQCSLCWKCLFERAIPKLETLFREGRASPNDVNRHNQTLIYPIAELVRHLLLYKWRSNVSDPFKRLVLDFLEHVTYLDIPSNIYDTDGESPIRLLILDFEDVSAKCVQILFGENADLPSMAISQEKPLMHFGSEDNKVILQSVMLQRKSQLIAEAYACGPLSQAILKGDSKKVKKLLETDRSSIMEVNGWGQTPLHLSITQPDMLELLLPALGPSQLDKPDFSGHTALHYALLPSALLCSVRNSDRLCHGCHCAAPMEMLLKAGCAIDIGVYDCLRYGMTKRGLRSLVRGWKDRRDKLQHLALEKLPERDIVALNLGSERTLDTRTAAVLGLLDLKGVPIPPALRLTQPKDYATSSGYLGLSVYHIVQNTMHADVFWDHGFQDIDEFDGRFDSQWGDGPPLASCENLDMIQWLVDHGANLSRELNHPNIGADRKALRVTTAHFVFRNIRDWLPSRDDLDECERDALSSLYSALPVDLFDNCECSCSKQGCTPFLMMLKALTTQISARKGQSIISVIKPFLKYLVKSRIESTKDEWKDAIRYFTFTTLEMSHTCHHEPGDYYRFTCSVTVEEWRDTMHVRDEQADMIELLEGILFDLDAMIDTMMDDENQFDMSAFLTDHWLKRMEAELEAISGHQLSEEYKKGTEALGVVWSEGKTEEDTDSKPTGDVQYWLNAIDKAAGV